MFHGVDGGGGGAGKATFRPITFVKMVDSTSPVLVLDAASGRHLRKVSFTFSKSGGGTSAVLETITLSDVVITHVSQDVGDIGSPAKFSTTPLEAVSLSYAKIEIVSGGQGACFDILGNATC